MLLRPDMNVKRHTLRLRMTLVWMTCNEVLDYVGEEVLKKYKMFHHTRDAKGASTDSIRLDSSNAWAEELTKCAELRVIV